MSQGLFDAYMSYTAPLGGSKIYHRWAILSVISALQERRTYYRLGGLGRIYPNLYVFLVGPAGSGKTVAGEVAVNLVREYNERTKNPADHLFMAPDKVTPARLLYKLEASFHQKKNQSALYQFATELSSAILDIGGGTIIPDLLKLYDCSGSFTKETMGGGELNIIRPCFNMLGCTTTTFLNSFLSREQVGTGMVSRIVFATDSTRYYFEDQVPDGDPVLFEQLVNEIRRVHNSKGEFHETEDAKAYFKPWHRKCQDDLWDTPDGTFMKDYIARKPVQARKVAMALSISRDSSLTITKEDYVRAIGFMEELETGLVSCFGTTDFRLISDFPAQILTKVPSEKWVREKDILQALWIGGLGGRIQDFRDNIETLIMSGQVKVDRSGDEPFYIRTEEK